MVECARVAKVLVDRVAGPDVCTSESGGKVDSDVQTPEGGGEGYIVVGLELALIHGSGDRHAGLARSRKRLILGVWFRV